MKRLIAIAEFRYQLLSLQSLLAFGVLFGVTFLLTANAGEFQTFAAGGLVLANSPFAITETLIKISVLAVLAVPPYMADAVLRDHDTRFAAILYATPIGKADYLLGRFAGAFAALMFAFSGAPLGLLLGSLWPWADATLLGPTRLDHYLSVQIGIVLPSMLAIAAIVFAVAVASRSLILSYLIILALLVLYLITGETNALPPVFDPFLFEVFDAETRYWTAAERNTRLLEFDGLVLASRLLWIAIAGVAFVVAYALFSFRVAAGSPAPSRAAADAAGSGRATSARAETLLTVQPVWRAATPFHQFAYRTRFEAMAVLRSLPFLLLMAMCFLLLTVELTHRELSYGVSALPVTRLMLPDRASITLLLLAVLAFYSAEILWRERSHRVNDIIDALPVGNAVFVFAKLAALALIAVCIQLLGVVIAIALQRLQGDTPIEWGLYLERGLWYPILPYLCLAVLTVFFQVLAQNRYIGMLLFGLFLGGIVVSRDFFGLEHPLLSYVFPAIEAPLSDMNGSGRFMALGYGVLAYWASIAGLLLLLTLLLYQRGTPQPLHQRLQRLAALRSPRLAAVLGLLVAAIVGTAGHVFYNTNVINDYRSETEAEALRATYERTWRHAASLPMPRTVAIDLNVDLYPDETRIAIRSRHLLQNKANTPLDAVHVVFPPGMTLANVAIEGGGVFALDASLVPYYVFQLDQPMLPGERRWLDYTAEHASKGFPHRRPDTRLIGSGTFVTDGRLVPTIGFAPEYMLQDRREREQNGLPPLPRRAPLGDARQSHNHAARQDSDFIDFEATVSTLPDQTAIAPGVLQREWVDGGRRYFHYRADAPIRNFFAILSGRYAVARERWNGVDIEVLHHPAHATNVPRMIAGVKDSLDSYTAAFGPYPFGQLRIAEFPSYREFTAQAFAGLIAFSEDSGFLADVKPGDIDMPYYVTAHEMAHQWWGHVVAGANTQGDGFIHETLAQYSALRVMTRRHGDAQIRRFLKYELDKYLAGRADDPEGEQPLYRVERQSYIHYHKGSLVMYALADYLGADVVERSLQRLVALRGFRSDPYASSADFLDILRQETDPRDHGLIEDLFTRITLFDLKLVGGAVSERDDGRFDVQLQLEATKFHAGADGAQARAALDLPISIGLFGRSPADPQFGASDVILLEKHVLRDGASALSLIVDRRPVVAGIDPYHTLIDRAPDDNLAELGKTSATPHATTEP
jgi:ABC-2 type transport system permease protein